MSLLRLSSVRVEWGGRTIGPLNAEYDGQLVLLFGDFDWLFAVLLGEAQLSSGALLCLDGDGRQATLSGRVGVSPAPILAAPSWTVLEWLTLNAELLGSGARQARADAQRILSELELGALGPRKVNELNGAESFAAHAAFAANSNAELVVLGAPLLLPETREYEFRVLRRLLDRIRVCVAMRRRDAELWDLADAHAYSDVSGRTRLPSDLARRAGPSYLVRTFQPLYGFAEALVARGATAAPSGPASWLVELPEGAGPGLIADAANEIGAALAELVSVNEAR
jgi:hypothetical protein